MLIIIIRVIPDFGSGSVPDTTAAFVAIANGEGTPLPTFPPSRRLRSLDLKTYRMGG